jgi:DNA-binding GntR family transcriptional regulator
MSIRGEWKIEGVVKTMTKNKAKSEPSVLTLQQAKRSGTGAESESTDHVVTNTTRANTGKLDQRTRAYESLRSVLVTGQISGGERLRETEWSCRLGVNRVALREALARLHSETLVVVGEKTGYFVPRLGKNDFKEILDIRLLTESYAVEQIIGFGLNRPRHLKSLHELCNELEWILKKGYTKSLYQADSLFHEKLISLGGNQRLIAVHRCLPQIPFVDTVLYPQQWSIMGRNILTQHRLILEGIQRGRSSQVKKVLQKHLTALLQKA